jgi:hypothetical protein
MARGHHSVRGRFVALVTLVFLSACQLNQTPSQPAALPLAAPPDDYYGVAWLADGTKVVGRNVGESHDARLGVIDESAGAIVDLQIQPDPNCAREFALSPQALQDGRLSYVHVCQHAVNHRPPDDEELWAVDVASGEVERLMAIGPLGTSQGVSYTVSRDRSEAIVGVGLICGYLVVNSRDGGPDRLEVVIKADGASFSLADPIVPGADCDQTGWATQPTLSPDGSVLAFLASAAAVGRSGRARLEAPANLYLLDLTTREVSALLTDLTDLGQLVWSPAGNRLALVGRVRGEAGTWAVSLDGATQRLAPSARRLAWSPDGTHILATFLTGDQSVPFMSTLGIIDAPTRPSD